MPTLQSASPGTSAVRTGPRGGGAGRVLLLAAVGPLVTGYLAIAAVLALVTATASGATVSSAGVLRAAGPAWLAMYHVPVFLSGHELGMLPLLPTWLVLTVVARSAANAVRRLDWDTPRQAVRVIAVIGGTHAVCAAGVAWLSTGTSVSAAPVVAFFAAGIFAGLAATVGTARPCELLPAALDRADVATVAGLRAGVLAVVGLTAVGAVVFAVGLLASLSRAARLLHGLAPGFGSGFGVFLLCLAYLPNVLVGTVSFAAGPGFTIGSMSVSQWAFHGGPVPAVPVLAPLPTVAAHWWPALTLLPVVVGVLVGRSCIRLLDRTGDRVQAVGVAALTAGMTWLVLAALAGGALAGGPFDPVTVPAGVLGVSVFLLIAVPGGVTVLLAGRGEPPVQEWAAEPEPEPEPEPESEADPEAEFEPEPDWDPGLDREEEPEPDEK
jgi:Family of unknown function (DUF6350)